MPVAGAAARDACDKQVSRSGPLRNGLSTTSQEDAPSFHTKTCAKAKTNCKKRTEAEENRS